VTSERRERREEVPEALAGERLDRMVAMITGCSRAGAAALVAAGAVTVDGAVRERGADRLSAGAELVIAVPTAADPRLRPDAAVRLAVVHADAEVIVVDKAPGLVVHPGSGVAEGTLVQGLLARFPEIADVGDPDRPGIVHRLDKGTSGLMVVARTAGAYQSLVAQLSERSVERRYLALVWGCPDTSQGMVDAPIGRSQRSPTRMAVSTRGRDARTRYDVLATFEDPAVLSLLACRLETGRTHQIRVHLAAIGHPVVGDDRYHGARPTILCPRPFLHATHLSFTHPRTGERPEFDSPLPGDLADVLAQLSVRPRPPVQRVTRGRVAADRSPSEESNR